MKRVGLIGLGTITKNYKKGLDAAEHIRLCAVCDISPTATSADVYREYPFYTDYKEMLVKEKPDLVIISTPPALHYEMACHALLQGVGVLVEKPATADIQEYESLLSIAKASKLPFEVIYHWQTGSEVQAFTTHFEKNEITSVFTQINDPYCNEDGSLKENKVCLGGVWLDSGVNVLSMLRLWFPFEQVKIKSIDTQKCPRTLLPVFIDLSLLIDGADVQIVIDWRQNINHKKTIIGYKDREITVDHSGQRIADGDTITVLDDMERLPRHYFNYFTSYKGETTHTAGMDIHRVLFAVNDQL